MPVFTGRICLDKLPAAVANQPDYQKYKQGSDKVAEQQVPKEGTGPCQKRKALKSGGFVFDIFLK